MPGGVCLLQLAVDVQGASWQVLLKPGVLQYACDADALLRVGFQHAAEEISAPRSDLPIAVMNLRSIPSDKGAGFVRQHRLL